MINGANRIGHLSEFSYAYLTTCRAESDDVQINYPLISDSICVNRTGHFHGSTYHFIIVLFGTRAFTFVVKEIFGQVVGHIVFAKQPPQYMCV